MIYEYYLLKEDEILYRFIVQYFAALVETEDFEMTRNFVRHVFQYAAHEIYFHLRSESPYEMIG